MLPSSVDRFGDHVTVLKGYFRAADRVAGRVLGVSAGVLEERERRGKEGSGSGSVGGGDGVGVREVMKGLSRVLK